MPIEVHKDGGFTATGKSVDFVRMAALKSALHLELVGMKRRGRSAYSIIREEFGLKGSREKVYEQFCKLVDAESAKQTRIYT